MLQFVAGTTRDIPYIAAEPDGTPAVAATITIRRMDTGAYWDDDAPGGAAWVVAAETNAMSAGDAGGVFWYPWTIPADLPTGTRLRIECAATDCLPCPQSVTVLGARIVETDDTDALQAHGDANWTTADGGTGAHSVTLYVKDEDGNPIAGAAVSIPTAGTQTSAASTGAVSFNLDAGTYTATIRSSAAYTPDASYTVTVNPSGAVTAPADAVLEVASASLPAPSSPDNYLLWCDETQVDYGDIAFGEGEMTVEIVRMSQAARKNVDGNKYRSFVQRSFSTDANGQWSIEIPKDVVAAGGTLTLRRQYTDENGYPVTEDTTVILDADMAEEDDTLAWTALQSTDNE